MEPNSKETTLIPKAKYLPIILEKLKELNAKKWIIKEEEEKLSEYQDLIRIVRESIKTPDDILTIYRNITRVDTYILRALIKGRNVQEDYDLLNEEFKVELVKILCGMRDDDLATLSMLTKADGEILSIESIDVLKNAVASVGLKCLRYAPMEYLHNKEKVLEILSLYDKKDVSTPGINFISEELQIDLDVLQALVKTEPYTLYLL